MTEVKTPRKRVPITDKTYYLAVQRVIRRYWELKHESHGKFIYAKDLSAFMGVNERTFERMRYEEGYPVSIIQIVKFCNGLGINIDTFLKDVAREVRKIQSKDPMNHRLPYQKDRTPRRQRKNERKK